MTSGVTCPKCEMMQIAGATCKRCGTALGAPAHLSGPPRGEITDRWSAPEALEAREADRVPEERWECGCGVTNAKWRERCAGCRLRYSDAMYHTRQAELYGYSPTLQENQVLSFWDRHGPSLGLLFPFSLVPLIIYGLFELIRPSRD